MRRRAPPAAALGALALPVDALSLQPAQQLHLFGRQLLVVLVGMPGSGKSTFAEELISQHPECWRRISQDVLGSRQRCIQRAKAALREGHHVLIDRCNFDESQRRSHTPRPPLRLQSPLVTHNPPPPPSLTPWNPCPNPWPEHPPHQPYPQTLARTRRS